MSYYTQRVIIGILGMMLPVILLISTFLEGGLEHLQVSISNFYYTNRGDFLVGVLCVLAVFLFSYTGPNDEKLDYWVSTIAAVCALGVAFYPTEIKEPITKHNIHIESTYTPLIKNFGEWHLLFGVLFFVAISFMCLFLFTKEPKGTRNWLKRRIIYILCGIIMLLSVIIIAIYMIGIKCDDCTVTFWGESVALFFFGIAWLTKGEALFPKVENNKRTVLLNILLIVCITAVILTVMFFNRTESQRYDKKIFGGTWVCDDDPKSTFTFYTDSMTCEINTCGQALRIQGKWDIRDIDFEPKATNFLVIKNTGEIDSIAPGYYTYRIDSAEAHVLYLTDYMNRNKLHILRHK
jgi:hypothetical protein